jgi:hypothetical protein
MEGKPLRRARPDAGQTRQLRDQIVYSGAQHCPIVPMRE